MESTDNVEREKPWMLPKKNTLPVIGFLLMLVGPAALILAGMFTSSFGAISSTSAGAIGLLAGILPGMGAIICCIVYFFWWQETGKVGRALTIVTLITCNPVFFLVYLGICDAASSEIAGRSFLVNM